MSKAFLKAFGNLFNFFPNTDYSALIKPQKPLWSWTVGYVPEFEVKEIQELADIVNEIKGSVEPQTFTST